MSDLYQFVLLELNCFSYEGAKGILLRAETQPRREGERNNTQWTVSHPSLQGMGSVQIQTLVELVPESVMGTMVETSSYQWKHKAEMYISQTGDISEKIVPQHLQL